LRKVKIDTINSFYNTNDKMSVFDLANKSISKFLEGTTLDVSKIGYVFVATASPDQLAPSLSQLINKRFTKELSSAVFVDVVQGCTGSMTAIELATKLSGMCNEMCLVIAADAAKNAVSGKNVNQDSFGNGSFCMSIVPSAFNEGVTNTFSFQVGDCIDVVSIKIGHITAQSDIYKCVNSDDFKDKCGLILNKKLALKFLKKAEQKLIDLISNKLIEVPDIILPHHASEYFVHKVASVFKKIDITTINCGDSVKNCGAATIGIILDKHFKELKNKKVLFLGYGTGAVVNGISWKM